MVCSTLERINQPEIDEGVLRSGLQTQSHLQSLLGWYLQQSNLQEQVFPFNLHFVFFFSAEIVTLLRKCMQLVIKRVLCLLMLLTAERSLKVVVSILLKNTERMEAEIPVPINHVFRKLLHINIMKPKRLVLKQNGFVQKFVISF